MTNETWNGVPIARFFASCPDFNRPRCVVCGNAIRADGSVCTGARQHPAPRPAGS